MLRDPPDRCSGGASCYHRCHPRSRSIAAAWASATYSWRSREREPGAGRAEAGAGLECQLLSAAGPTQPRPAPLAPASQWRGEVGFLCKSAEASAFIEKSTEPAPPSIHPSSLSPSFPSSRFPALFRCCVNRGVFWMNGRTGRGLCNQAFSLILHLRE